MLTTEHRLFFSDSRELSFIKDESVNLIVTSPPYPMIEMWDDLFCSLNPDIKNALREADGRTAFELMHKELDKVWSESFRVLKDGGFACINIGDATRTIGKRFQLYSNHARIINYCTGIGFDTLPVILWRKQTNAPNKFMGSGMLPAGAYVTLEHEYILIFRKGAKRLFRGADEKLDRQQSSFFWEERNKWFSDIWDFKGINQNLSQEDLRERSAAYPFELAYRLINMYSVKGDTVLDPFLGTGTTTFAAIASCRNSLGVEIDENFRPFLFNDLEIMVPFLKGNTYLGVTLKGNTYLGVTLKGHTYLCVTLNSYISKRLSDHLAFVQDYLANSGCFKYANKHYNFPVMTKQEVEIILNYIREINIEENYMLKVEYIEEAIIKDYQLLKMPNSKT